MFKRILKIVKPVLNDHWRVLITGVTSIHGWPIYKYVRTLLRPENLFAIRPPKMDIPDNENIISLCMTDTAGLKKIKETFNPTHIIICSGVCDLDVCEERPDWAYALNVIGAGNIINLFEEHTYIMYLSSDLVFSGNNPPPQGYTEEDAPNPVSVAGKTILGAEQEILKAQKNCIIRLGLPVGDSITGTKGGADWVEGRFRKNRPVTLFHDEFRSCIACDEIADIVTCLFSQEIQGLYHLGGETPVSLYELGKYVLKRGLYPEKLLNTISRHNEIDGPPRIGNVSLNSKKVLRILRYYAGYV